MSSPRYEFYSALTEKNNFIIMTGDTQPSFDDVVAHYALCSENLDFVLKKAATFWSRLVALLSRRKKLKCMLQPLHLELALEFMEKGAVIYSKGRVVGATGLTLGLAKERGLEGICLLGATTGFKADRGAGFAVFKFLMKALGNEVKEGL